MCHIWRAHKEGSYTVMAVHLDYIQVKFEYQGRRVNIMVTWVNWTPWTVGYQILLLWPTYGQGHLRWRSFQNHIVSVWISFPKRVVGFRPNAFLLISLRHSVNGDFCGHSRFVLWHQNLTTFVSWTLAKSESCGGVGGGGVGLNFIIWSAENNRQIWISINSLILIKFK